MIDAYGPERLMWGSDYTRSRETYGRPWSEALHYLLDANEVSEEEKTWVMGRTALTLLRWDSQP
jgi:hypothetical protein